MGLGDEVAYRVTPMIGLSDALKEAKDQASPWSPTVAIGAESEGRAAIANEKDLVENYWMQIRFRYLLPGSRL